MAVVKRTDERAAKAEAAVEANGGYCPCRINKEPKYKCQCREFRVNCMQNDWYGVCRCGLYEKVKDND